MTKLNIPTIEKMIESQINSITKTQDIIDHEPNPIIKKFLENHLSEQKEALTNHKPMMRDILLDKLSKNA